MTSTACSKPCSSGKQQQARYLGEKRSLMSLCQVPRRAEGARFAVAGQCVGTRADFSVKGNPLRNSLLATPTMRPYGFQALQLLLNTFKQSAAFFFFRYRGSLTQGELIQHPASQLQTANDGCL